MSSPFRHRGIIEGYYGPPYSTEDRHWWIERLGRWGANTYCYAPKNDPLQRAQWRTPYDDAAMRAFSDLVHAGDAAGVAFGFCVSPGLSIQYASADDRRLLVAKLSRFAEIGSRFLMLAFDDVPSHLVHDADRSTFRSLAAAQIALTHAVREVLPAAVTLVFGPVDYVGTRPTDYLEELGSELAPTIEVFWTGRTVCSPEIRADEAAARAATLRRKLLVWDNVPVSDGPMKPMLHLGPFARREPGLVDSCSGFLLNTMEHAHASGVAVHTACAWLRDPRAYDAEDAWRAACDEIGDGAADLFRRFAAAHRFSAIAPDDRDRELERCFDALRAELAESGDPYGARAALRAALDARSGCAESLRERLADRDLANEIEPWLAAHHAETERMRAALQLIDAVCDESIARLHRVFAFFALAAKASQAPPSSAVSYGPRRAFYPQLASLRDDEAGFGADPALFLDRSLADAVCRFAERFALERLGGHVA